MDHSSNFSGSRENAHRHDVQGISHMLRDKSFYTSRRVEPRKVSKTMSGDELSREDALDLLHQTRFELARCKKSLAFKENLLLELEFEVTDLTRRNERLQKDFERQQLRERQRRSPELGNSTDSDPCSDRSRGGTPISPQSAKMPKVKKPSTACEGCRLSEAEKVDLINCINELKQQKERLSDVNQRLLRNLNAKTAQLNKIAADASKEKALRKNLEASLEFLTVEKEIIERDLRDFRESSSPFARLSEISNRGMSHGSSLGDELGLEDGRVNFGERKTSLPFDWQVDIERPVLQTLQEKHDFPETKKRRFLDSTEEGFDLRQEENGENSERIERKAEGNYRPQPALNDSDPETDDNTHPRGRKQSSSSFGWRSLMCIPYRRFVKRRRMR